MVRDGTGWFGMVWVKFQDSGHRWWCSFVQPWSARNSIGNSLIEAGKPLTNKKPPIECGKPNNWLQLLVVQLRCIYSGWSIVIHQSSIKDFRLRSPHQSLLYRDHYLQWGPSGALVNSPRVMLQTNQYSPQQLHSIFYIIYTHIISFNIILYHIIYVYELLQYMDIYIYYNIVYKYKHMYIYNYTRT